jgi:hypothetical protein
MAQQSESTRSDNEKDGRVSAVQTAGAQAIIIRPGLGTGWETTVDDSKQEVRMRFRVLGLPLPVGKRLSFSEVSHVSVLCRESWWSRTGGFLVFPRNLASSGPGTRPDRTPMPTRGWRYDLLMTRKGGRTVKIVTLRPSDAAYDTAAQLRHRVGLPPEP